MAQHSTEVGVTPYCRVVNGGRLPHLPPKLLPRQPATSGQRPAAVWPSHARLHHHTPWERQPGSRGPTVDMLPAQRLHLGGSPSAAGVGRPPLCCRCSPWRQRASSSNSTAPCSSTPVGSRSPVATCSQREASLSSSASVVAMAEQGAGHLQGEMPDFARELLSQRPQPKLLTVRRTAEAGLQEGEGRVFPAQPG